MGWLNSVNLALFIALGAIVYFYFIRVDVLLVGNVTLDVFADRPSALGGSVSYGAYAANAFGMRTCIVTTAGKDIDTSILPGIVHVVPTNNSMIYEHSYTFWGNRRKLKVLSQPETALTAAHIPWRCRNAKIVILGPLTRTDVDLKSFMRHLDKWQFWRTKQTIHIMAQGLQRDLDTQGNVAQLDHPTLEMMDAAHPSAFVYLSDVETDVWQNGTLESLVQKTKRFIVTRGRYGADEWNPSRRQTPVRLAPYSVSEVVDTNGAGDSFALAYAIAATASHKNPGFIANWAGAMAVSQPQRCKPGCIQSAIELNKTETMSFGHPNHVVIVSALIALSGMVIPRVLNASLLYMLNDIRKESLSK